LKNRIYLGEKTSCLSRNFEAVTNSLLFGKQFIHRHWIYSCQKAGAGEILLTSIDREGTGEGFDLDLLRALKSDIDVPLIVSGGMGKLKDISEVAQFDVGAIAMAHVLHNDILSLRDIRKYANENGVRVRKFETLTM